MDYIHMKKFQDTKNHAAVIYIIFEDGKIHHFDNCKLLCSN